jgi:hypothetical protein
LKTMEFQRTNLIVVGPSMVALKDQFSDDYKVWEQGRKKVSRKEIIVNSTSLRKQQGDFLERLQDTKFLHIIVHDEAHWGIAINSQINSFLGEINEIIESTNGGSKPTVLILLVSATIAGLDQGVSIFTDGCKSVDWSSLLASNDYKADTYRGISDLEIEYSDSGEKIEEDTVIDEYLDAAVHISAMKTAEIKTVGIEF